jgi:hypothetical protein
MDHEGYCKHGNSLLEMCVSCEQEAYDSAVKANWQHVDDETGDSSRGCRGCRGLDLLTVYNKEETTSTPSTPSTPLNIPPTVIEGIELFRKYMRLTEPQFRACLTAAVTAGIKACNKPIIFFEGPTDVGKTTRGCFLVMSTRSPEEKWSADTFQKNIFAFPRNIQDHHLISQKWEAALYDDIQTTDNAIYKMICLTSTGGSMPVRKLYTDQEIIAIGSSMLVVYTGLSAADMPPDLLNRHIIIDVEPIPDADMEDEDVLLERYCEDLSKIQTAVRYLRQHVQIQLADKNLKRPPIPRQCRLRTFARAGYLVSLSMGWPSFIDDYATLMGTPPKESPKKIGDRITVIERRAVQAVTLIVDKTPPGGTGWRFSVGSLYDSFDSSLKAMFGSKESLGAALKNHIAPMLETTGRTVVHSGLRGSSVWSVSSPHSKNLSPGSASHKIPTSL